MHIAEVKALVLKLYNDGVFVNFVHYPDMHIARYAVAGWAFVLIGNAAVVVGRIQVELPLLGPDELAVYIQGAYVRTLALVGLHINFEVLPGVKLQPVAVRINAALGANKGCAAPRAYDGYAVHIGREAYLYNRVLGYEKPKLSRYALLYGAVYNPLVELEGVVNYAVYFNIGYKMIFVGLNGNIHIGAVVNSVFAYLVLVAHPAVAVNGYRKREGKWGELDRNIQAVAHLGVGIAHGVHHIVGYPVGARRIKLIKFDIA